MSSPIFCAGPRLALRGRLLASPLLLTRFALLGSMADGIPGITPDQLQQTWH